MFAQRLFPARLYAPRYFPKTGASSIVAESYPGQHIASLILEFDVETGRWVTYEILGPDLQRQEDEDWLLWLSML